MGFICWWFWRGKNVIFIRYKKQVGIGNRRKISLAKGFCLGLTFGGTTSAQKAITIG